MVSPAGLTSAVAGNIDVRDSYSGDGGPDTSERLSFPIGVAVDNVGNLYISATDNQCIRQVDTNMIITTVAGWASIRKL